MGVYFCFVITQAPTMKSKNFSLQARTKGVIVEVVIFLLIILFLYASLSKLSNLQLYQLQMSRQPLAPWLSKILTWTLPPIELLIVGTLAYSSLFSKERLRAFGLYASLILMSAFTLYSATVLFHIFPKIPCSCGGIIATLSWKQHVILNASYVTIILIAIRLGQANIQSKKAVSVVSVA